MSPRLRAVVNTSLASREIVAIAPAATAPRSNARLAINPALLSNIHLADPNQAKQDADAAYQAKQDGIRLEIANAKWRVDHAYEITPLSYLPPKLSDDGNASRFLTLVTNVHWSGGKGEFDWLAGQTYELGWANNLMNADPPLMQQLWDLTDGVLQQLSTGYEAAKNAVVSVVAAGISLSGVVECSGSCHAALKTALEGAIASCGIPPKVPNVRQLYANGTDYLAANIADAVIEQGIGVNLPGGVAGDLAQAAARDQARAAIYQGARAGADALVQQLGCADPSAPNCGVNFGVPSTWGAPDPYFRRHPGVLYVRIRVVEPQLTTGGTPVSLVVNADGFTPVSAILPLGYIPPAGVIVPIVLPPDPASPWKVAGYMNGLDCECGQPYYWGGGSTVKLTTVHMFASAIGNPPFVVQHDWDPIELDTAHAQDFADGNIFDSFYGDNRPTFVHLP